MTKPLYILKLGGSVITDKKNNRLSVNKKNLVSAAKAIAKASKKLNLVIVHGAGAFGHKIVKDYKIKNGVKTAKQLEGVVRTHDSMESLNKVVVETLISQKVRAITVQPSACLMQNKKKIIKFYTKQIEGFLKLGLVPVLYGDMVLDKSLGASVVSGDAIIAYLAKKLKPKRVLLGTDVNGIYDSNPKKNMKAKLVKEINNKNISQILKGASGSSSIDVTAGMKGKLLELKKNIKGRECYIFNLEKQGNLALLLTGKKPECTRLYFK